MKIYYIFTVYVDMGRGSGNPVVLSVVSNGDKMSRRWKIKISMIECGSLNMGKLSKVILSISHVFKLLDLNYSVIMII